MPPREVADIGQKIADALVAAHDLGVLHRDIKPGNILVKRYGTVGLADFGLAALMETGRDTSVTLAALTPAYAAPEQFHLAPPTPQSDVYALAATLYTLLAGRPPRYPHDGELSVPEIVRRHDLPLEDIAGVPPEFMSVLRRGLAKEPAHRYPEAAALRADLSQLTVGDYHSPRHAVTSAVTTVAAPRVSAPPAPFHPPAPSGPAPFQQDSAPPPKPGRRWVALVGAALAAALVLTGVWYFALRDDDAKSAAGSPKDTDTGVATETTADTYGVRTVSAGCAAAGVDGGQAQCVEKAECWSGYVMINGEINSIRRLPCEQGHIYEVYAIALVPGDVSDPNADTLAEHPVVRRVCAMENLLASRFGDSLSYGAERWDTAILPPSTDDRSRELGVYRCVATLTDVSGITGSVFRPR
jgi:hypothetical protein